MLETWEYILIYDMYLFGWSHRYSAAPIGWL